tara:strand:- start:655 stop:816 length:162 start_codon:yes stop_codon:yes gene_type:complete
MNLIGDSRLGPYLTFTLFFFNDKKISSELTNEKEDNKKKVTRILIKNIFLNIL